jgi:hypothetical protein
MLFRNEQPNLGPSTTINSTVLKGDSNTTVAAFDHKPQSREIVNLLIAAATTDGWAFVAPFACEVVAIRFVNDVVANSTQTIQVYKLPYASQPAHPAGTGAVVLTAAATGVGSTSTADAVAYQALTTTLADRKLAVGDLIGFHISGTLTSLAGGLLQIEIIES